jgi:hypothetical protein
MVSPRSPHSEEVKMPKVHRRPSTRRLARLFGAVSTAVALLAVLPASSASAAEVKPFVGVKDCNNIPSPPDPGGYCRYTESNLKILRNATVYYTDSVVDWDAGVLTSPITLVALDKRRSTATGYCTFYFATITGHCVYWSGTGKLTGFHADIHVAAVIPGLDNNVYTLTGTYWFDRDSHDQDN